MKVLFIDIETSPNSGYFWGLWNQNIGLNQLLETGEVICFAAKWLDSPKVIFHKGPGMVQAAYDLLNEADVVVHYNGESFDVPHLNRMFLFAELPPPAPFAQVDLLRAVRKRFRFPSNKLEHVSQALGIGQKVKHEGFGLWKACLDGDAKAWKRMEKYNRQDVLLTEELYLRILPWIPGHPSRHLYDGTPGCPTCGSHEHLMRRGYAYTRLGKFLRYQCMDCGSYFRASRRESGIAVQQVAS